MEASGRIVASRPFGFGSCPRRGLTSLVALSLAGLAGCSPNVVIGGLRGSGGSSSHAGEGGGTQAVAHPTVDKIDLLLAIDNSTSMTDKQQILAAAVPDLVARLANPLCIDPAGLPTASQPSTPLDPCPPGAHREFNPIDDINIGIVDSSLGADGADACPDDDPNRNNDDHGHLVARGGVGTYQGRGYLAWDPANKRGGITDVAALSQALTSMVVATDQSGCGYEQQLESVVRFLVDPAPYGALEKGPGALAPVYPVGADTTLLSQRAAFLRPDSLVAIVMLTDENDCSIDLLGPQNYAVLNAAPFFRGSSVCATSPNDPCCYSCGLSPPQGCASDPACGVAKLSAAEDPVDLKCFHQKQRYGHDFLYPVKRYVNALTSPEIDPTRSDLAATSHDTAAPNPLFSDLSGMGVAPRDPGLVFMVGIVGVPAAPLWRQPSDPSRGLKTHDELAAAGFYDAFVGAPDGYVEPTDPIMKEDFHQRGVPAGSANGGDRSIDVNAPNDLQYACIFDLVSPEAQGNDCKPGTETDNPVCTAGGVEPQIKGKAYPGLRELAVLHGLGAQGVTASICPSNVAAISEPTYGYRPVVQAFVERIAPRLAK